MEFLEFLELFFDLTEALHDLFEFLFNAIYFVNETSYLDLKVVDFFFLTHVIVSPVLR